MLVFEILDDKRLILEKNLKRNSKMMILGIDDHGHMLTKVDKIYLYFINHS